MVSVSVGGLFKLGINDGQVAVDVNVGGAGNGSDGPSTTQYGNIESPDSPSDETGTEEAFNVSELAPGTDEEQSIDDSLSLDASDDVPPVDNGSGDLLSDMDRDDIIAVLQLMYQLIPELLSQLGAAPSAMPVMGGEQGGTSWNSGNGADLLGTLPVGSLPTADAQQGGASWNSGAENLFDFSSFSGGPIGAETLAGGGLKTPAPDGLADAGGQLNAGKIDGLAAANGASDIGNTDLMSAFPSTGQGMPQIPGGGAEGNALLSSINDRLVSIETMFAQLIGIDASI